MAENVAGVLSYAGLWVTGLILFLIDKRPFVRFHAAQSIVVFGGLHIIYIILAQVFFQGLWTGALGVFPFAWLLDALRLLAFVLWIVLMVKAYRHERFEVPIAAGIAESFAHKK